MNQPLKVTGRVLPISAATRKRNPQLYGPVQAANPALDSMATKIHQPTARPALEQNLSRGQSSPCRLECVVEIIALRNAVCDADNSRNGYKPLQDAIAASLYIDDGSERIRWEYGQCHTAGPEGTIVRIAWV